jgi:hypothetical protein
MSAGGGIPEQFERLRAEVARRREETLLEGQRASDDIVRDYLRVIHNTFEGWHPGVKSYSGAFGFDGLNSFTRGCFYWDERRTEFNREYSDGLRLLFGKTALGPDDLVLAKDALRCAIHEAGHALTSRGYEHLAADGALYRQEVEWVINLEEGLVEAHARRRVGDLIRSLGLEAIHPGVAAAGPPTRRSYNAQVAAVETVVAWAEETCGTAAQDLIETLCLRASSGDRPRVLADLMLDRHRDFEPFRKSGKLGENLRRRFRREVAVAVCSGQGGFGDEVNVGQGARTLLESLVARQVTAPSEAGGMSQQP